MKHMERRNRNWWAFGTSLWFWVCLVSTGNKQDWAATMDKQEAYGTPGNIEGDRETGQTLNRIKENRFGPILYFKWLSVHCV